MPLLTSSHPLLHAQLPSTHYLIFFSSGTPPWCPDCVDALPAIHAVFGSGPTDKQDGPTAQMMLVERSEWKAKAGEAPHPWRKEYGVSGVPTILKWSEGKEVGRLDEDGCKDEAQLKAFAS